MLQVQTVYLILHYPQGFPAISYSTKDFTFGTNPNFNLKVACMYVVVVIIIVVIIVVIIRFSVTFSDWYSPLPMTH